MSKYLVITCLLLLPTLVSARWIADIAIIENDDIGSIEFSHYQHLDAVGRDCVLCHNRLFHIDPKKNQPVSMEEMAKGKSCGACHNGDMAFSVKENCESCHDEYPPPKQTQQFIIWGNGKTENDLSTLF